MYTEESKMHINNYQKYFANIFLYIFICLDMTDNTNTDNNKS